MTHPFKYKVEIMLKNGRRFPRTGIIQAIHQRDAISQLLALYPGSNPIAEPYLNGRATGSDLTFKTTLFKKEKFTDKVN